MDLAVVHFDQSVSSETIAGSDSDRGRSYDFVCADWNIWQRFPAPQVEADHEQRCNCNRLLTSTGSPAGRDY